MESPGGQCNCTNTFSSIGIVYPTVDGLYQTTMRVLRIRLYQCLKLALVISCGALLLFFLCSHSTLELPDETRINRLYQEETGEVNYVGISRDFFNYLVQQLTESPFPGVQFYTEYTVARLGIKPFADENQLRSGFGPVWNDVTSFRYTIDIGPCRIENSDVPSIFVAVISAPANYAKRQSIRQTWFHHIRKQQTYQIAGLAFILGSLQTGSQNSSSIQEKIEKESLMYSDIIQVDMVDTYHNLSVKVMALLNWANSNCKIVNFVLKVDDDVYVNVQNFASMIKNIQHSIPASVYGTHQANTITPLRDGKWAVDYNTWPWTTYPKFLIGAAVLMTGSAVNPLLAAAQTTPTYVWDDVYFFGLCAMKAGLQLYSSDSLFDINPRYPLDDCMARDTITWLTGTTKEMNDSHAAVEQFYRGKKRCVYVGPNGLNPEVADPHNAIPFSFDRIYNAVT